MHDERREGELGRRIVGEVDHVPGDHAEQGDHRVEFELRLKVEAVNDLACSIVPH